MKALPREEKALIDTANTTGSNFTAGTLAVSGVAGLAIGAIATALGMTVTKKKKKETA